VKARDVKGLDPSGPLADNVERIQDAGKRRLPFQRKVGVGLSVAEFEKRVAARTLRHVGLGESLHFLAHYLGWRIERWEETIAPVLAERALTSDLGPVVAGAARGVRQEARAWVDGRVALELVFQASLGEPEPRDRALIEGEPPVELVIPGGVHGDAHVLFQRRPTKERRVDERGIARGIRIQPRVRHKTGVQ